ncbi:MAG TPA: hypothetical protein VFZ78_13150, partial [Flavisolibacter sp.]
MPGRTALIIFLMLLCTRAAVAQSGKDSLAIVNVTDTSYVDYDELFDELEHFLDSITAPRDLTMFNIGVVSSYFNYESKSTYVLEASRKLLYIPTVAFYSRTGFGIGVTALVVNDGKNINPFQMYFTGSYDYLANRKFLTGISYSRYLTKDSLPFYTSPLKNELYAYFTYRDFWVRPSVSVSYGWGSRTDYAQREEYINSLLLRPSGYTNIN